MAQGDSERFFYGKILMSEILPDSSFSFLKFDVVYSSVDKSVSLAPLDGQIAGPVGYFCGCVSVVGDVC